MARNVAHGHSRSLIDDTGAAVLAIGQQIANVLPIQASATPGSADSSLIAHKQ
jgi:hypothetical protein